MADTRLADLLALLEAVSDQVDELAGDAPGAQENRTIVASRAHLARVEAREVRAAVGELRRRARALTARARAARPGASHVVEGSYGDPGALAAARAIHETGSSPDGERARAQHLVEQARGALGATSWARLALVSGADVLVWSAGELAPGLVAAVEEGPQAAVLAGAGVTVVEEGDARWPALAAGLGAAGWRSVHAVPLGGTPPRGALVLVGARVLDDDDRCVAHRLAEHAAAALWGCPAPGRDAAGETIDGARVALGHHLGVRSADTFDVLLDTAAAVGDPVLAVAERLVAALVPRASTADPEAVEPEALHRAVSYADRHAAEPLGIDDLARAAGVGARGLQHLFRKHRDLAPLEYVRQVRLDRAHAELAALRPGSGATVGAVAARWHFTNPGRFSIAYRERFGVSPSVTLRT